MKIIFYFTKYPVLIFLLFGLTASFANEKDKKKNPLDYKFKKADDKGVTEEGEKLITSANNKFALDLYSYLNSENSNENIFFSPYGIFTAMAMTYEGSGGRTAKEMRSVFQFPADKKVRRSGVAGIYNQLNAPEGGYKLLTANALWIQRDLKSKIFKEIKKYYGAEVFVKTPVEKVNQWIEHKTMNKFKNVLKSSENGEPPALTLINTIYFKGDWKQKFEKTNTRDQPFIISKKEEIKVPMMNRTETFNYMETEKMQMLEMPYKGEKLSMLILLPKDFPGKPKEKDRSGDTRSTSRGIKADLVSLEKALTEENLKKWKSGLFSKELMVYIPKFTFQKDYGLSKTLKPYMPSAFNTRTADFLKFGGKLHITNIIHKSFIDVNEEGTEAAAVTTVSVGITSSPPPPPVFKANHPFIFLIQERKTGQILFIGKVVNPIQ